MKYFCKRGLSLFLALLMLVGTLSGLSFGAAAVETTDEERGRQAVAVALAYFDKGHSVQYDGKSISTPPHRFDGGKTRSTNGVSPEFATPHETMYTVCSDFMHQIYWEAFRFDLLGKGPGYVATTTLSNVREPAPVDPADEGYADYLIKKRNAEMLVWSYDPYSTASNPTAEMQQMYALAKPGDVFTAFSMKLVDGELTPVGGHAMLWAGDVTGDGRPDIIHSGGRHMLEDSKIDRREYYDENDPYYIADNAYYSADGAAYHDTYSSFGTSTNGGSIRIADAQEYINEHYVKRNRRMSLLRPSLAMTDETYPVRAASQYRVTHPGLTIDRTLVDKTRFNSAFTGETVTLALEITNNSARHKGFVSGDDDNFDDTESEDSGTTVQAALQSEGVSATVFAAGAMAELQAEETTVGEAYTVTVKETAPAGTRIKTPFPGATVIGDTMTLNVPLAAGATVRLTAEYEITAELGETVVFDGGYVGDIPSNSIPIQVGGRKLTEKQQAKLAAIANGEYNSVLSAAGATNTTLGKVVYEKIFGLEVSIPKHTTVTGKLVKHFASSRKLTAYQFLTKDAIAEANLPDYQTIVRNCWGGMSVWNEDIEWHEFAYRRCSDPRDMHLEPGDIIVRSDTFTNTTGYQQLVYLGNGKYLSYDKATGTYPIVNEREFFRCLFYKIFYVIRPTLQAEKLYVGGVEQEWSLNLNDNIVINYYLTDPDNRFAETSTVLVDGEEMALTKENNGWYAPIGQKAAKDMGAQSTIQLMARDAEGEIYYGKQHTVSVRDYAEQVLGMLDWTRDKDAKLGRAMIAMLNYGAKAQNHFGHNTEDLANKNLTTDDQAKMTVYTDDKIAAFRAEQPNEVAKTDTKGLYYASTCVLGSSQSLRFYLNLSKTTEREDLQYVARYRSYNGKENAVTRSFAELTRAAEGIYYFEVPNMAAADVQTNVTLTVMNGEAQIAKVTDSIAGYCARVYAKNPGNAALHEVVDATLVYGLSARDYFFESTLVGEENELPIC